MKSGFTLGVLRIIETNEIVIDYLSSTGETYEISVNIPESAGIPKGAELVVTELTSDTQTYEDEIADLVNGTVNTVRLFDIEIQKDGKKIQPSTPVEVTIKLKGEDFAKTTEVVHFAEEGAELLDNEKFEDSVIFETGSFSVFGVVTLETTYITAEGETYKITVTYGPEAEIPDDAELKVREIEEGSEEYFDYYNKALNAAGLIVINPEVINETVLPTESTAKVHEKISFMPDARFFDVSIMVGGAEIEPKTPVEVKVEYAESLSAGSNDSISAVHFTDSGDELLDAHISGNDEKQIITHIQDGFSVTGDVVISIEGEAKLMEDGSKTAEFTNLPKKDFNSDFDSSIVETKTAKFTSLRAEGTNNGPKTIKTVSNNGDGTYKVALDIIGEVEHLFHVVIPFSSYFVKHSVFHLLIYLNSQNHSRLLIYFVTIYNRFLAKICSVSSLPHPSASNEAGFSISYSAWYSSRTEAFRSFDGA